MTDTATPAAPFTWTVRVYYEDTDAGGVVFYANYLKFFERARTEWLRAAGVGQHALLETHGVVFVVRSTTVDYHAPARLDDVLTLSVTIEKLGRASVQFLQHAWRGDELLATGRIKVGCIELAGFKPCAIPPQVIASIQQ